MNQTFVNSYGKKDSRVILNSDKYHLKNNATDYSSKMNSEKLNQ